MLTVRWCPCVESSLVLLEEGVCYDQWVLLTKLCWPLPCFVLYCKGRFACYSRYLLTSNFCIPVLDDEKYSTLKSTVVQYNSFYPGAGIQGMASGKKSYWQKRGEEVGDGGAEGSLATGDGGKLNCHSHLTLLAQVLLLCRNQTRVPIFESSHWKPLYFWLALPLLWVPRSLALRWRFAGKCSLWWPLKEGVRSRTGRRGSWTAKASGAVASAHLAGAWEPKWSREGTFAPLSSGWCGCTAKAGQLRPGSYVPGGQLLGWRGAQGWRAVANSLDSWAGSTSLLDEHLCCPHCRWGIHSNNPKHLVIFWVFVKFQILFWDSFLKN